MGSLIAPQSRQRGPLGEGADVVPKALRNMQVTEELKRLDLGIDNPLLATLNMDYNRELNKYIKTSSFLNRKEFEAALALEDKMDEKYLFAKNILGKVQKDLAGSESVKESREWWAGTLEKFNEAYSSLSDESKKLVERMRVEGGNGPGWETTKKALLQNLKGDDAMAGALMTAVFLSWQIEESKGKFKKILGRSAFSAVVIGTEIAGPITMKSAELGFKLGAWTGKEVFNLLFNASKLASVDSAELFKGNLKYLVDGKNTNDRMLDEVPLVAESIEMQAKMVSPELGVPLQKILDNEELGEDDINNAATYFYKAQKHHLTEPEREKFLAEVKLMQNDAPYRDEIVAKHFQGFLVTHASMYTFNCLTNDVRYNKKFTDKLNSLYETENRQRAKAKTKGIPYHSKVKLDTLLSEKGKNASPEEMKDILYGLNIVNVTAFLWVAATLFANVSDWGIKGWNKLFKDGKKERAKESKDKKEKKLQESKKIKPKLKEKLRTILLKNDYKEPHFNKTLKLLTNSRVISPGHRKTLLAKIKTPDERRQFFEAVSQLNLDANITDVQKDFIDKVNSLNNVDLSVSGDLKLKTQFKSFRDSYSILTKDREAKISSVNLKCSHQKKSASMGKGKEIDKEFKFKNVKYFKYNLAARTRATISPNYNTMVFSAEVANKKGKMKRVTYCLFKKGNRVFLEKWPVALNSFVISDLDMNL